jgi:hypothetical protein
VAGETHQIRVINRAWEASQDTWAKDYGKLEEEQATSKKRRAKTTASQYFGRH